MTVRADCAVSTQSPLPSVNKSSCPWLSKEGISVWTGLASLHPHPGNIHPSKLSHPPVLLLYCLLSCKQLQTPLCLHVYWTPSGKIPWRINSQLKFLLLLRWRKLHNSYTNGFTKGQSRWNHTTACRSYHTPSTLPPTPLRYHWKPLLPSWRHVNNASHHRWWGGEWEVEIIRKTST